MRRRGAPRVTPPPFIVVALLLLGLAQSAAVVIRLTAPASERDDTWALPDPAAPPGATGPAAASAGVPAPDADPVRDILDRPVFHPRRRLSSLGEPRSTQLPAEPAGRLVGVMIGATGREALFAEANNRVIIIRQGGTLHGWTVETIEPDRVILTSSQGQRTMNLVTDRLQPLVPGPAGPTVVVPPGQTLWRPVPAPVPLDPATSGQPAARGPQAGEGR